MKLKQYAADKTVKPSVINTYFPNQLGDDLERYKAKFGDMIDAWYTSHCKMFPVFTDSLWDEALQLSRKVYDPLELDKKMQHPATLSDSGCVLAAAMNIFVSTIEEKCKVFLGLPEGVPLIQRMVTVSTRDPKTAKDSLFTSSLLKRVLKQRAEENRVFSQVDVALVADRFENHVLTPYRPSIFENFGETAKNDGITSGAGNTVIGTTTAANTHAKTLLHFLRVACNRYDNKIDIYRGQPFTGQTRHSAVRTLLQSYFNKLSKTGDASILYGNAVDCEAFRALIESRKVDSGIIPSEFVRDMERTPYMEIRESNFSEPALPVEANRHTFLENAFRPKCRRLVKFTLNAGQLVCDMLFGSDWDAHLKDYYSLQGRTSFESDSDFKTLKNPTDYILLMDNHRLGIQDMALVSATRFIQTVADSEMDRILRAKAANRHDGTVRFKVDDFDSATISNKVRLVVNHLYFDFFESQLQQICTNITEAHLPLLGRASDPKGRSFQIDETKRGELEEVVSHLFLSRLVDSLHILRNDNIQRTCYIIDVSLVKGPVNKYRRRTRRVAGQVYSSLSTVPRRSIEGIMGARKTYFKGNSISVCWDSISRRVISMTRASNLPSKINLTQYESDKLENIKGYRKLLTCAPRSRFFNLQAQFKALQALNEVSPIPHRFTCREGRINLEAPISLHHLEQSSARPFFSDLRDVIEAGAIRGVAKDIDTTVRTITEDAGTLTSVLEEERVLRDSLVDTLNSPSVLEKLVMSKSEAGIEMATFKDTNKSLFKASLDLKANRTTISEFMDNLGVTIDKNVDILFSRDMEGSYPDAAIDRWKEGIKESKAEIPESQIKKLEDIDKAVARGDLSDYEITDNVNDTELSKATDSIFKKAIGNGSTLLKGRYVIITVLGAATGILGKAVADIIHCSKGAHYNVKDPSTGRVTSYKLVKFSCRDHTVGNSNMATHPFESEIEYEARTKANASVCGEKDAEAGRCGRWVHYWPESVLPWISPMKNLEKGTSLSCDKGMSVPDAVADVLSLAGAHVLEKMFDVEVIKKNSTDLFHTLINSRLFILGLPTAIGIASTKLQFNLWRRGVAVALGLVITIMIMRLYAGSISLTLTWFRGTELVGKKGGSANRAAFRTLTETLPISRGFRKIFGNSRVMKPLLIPNRGCGDDSNTGGSFQKENTKGRIENSSGIKNYKIIRPIFGPAKTTQALALYHVGLLTQ